MRCEKRSAHFRRWATLGACVLIASFSVVSQASHGQTSQALGTGDEAGEVIVLQPNDTQSVEIPNGQTKSAAFELEKGQYVRIDVKCPGRRMGIHVFNPSGIRFENANVAPAEFESPVPVVASATGRYRLALVNYFPKPTPASCSFTLNEPRPATDKDAALQRARSLSNQSHELEERLKVRESLEPADAALGIFEKELGPNDPAVAMQASMVGYIHLLLGEDAKAEPYYLRSLAIWEKIEGPVNEGTFDATKLLGQVYFELGDMDRGVPFMQRAVEIKEKMSGPDDPDLALPLMNLSNGIDQQGEPVKAEELLERAIAIYEKAYGPDYPRIGFILGNLAGMYSERGDYLKAEAGGRRSVALYEKAYGPDTIKLIFPLINLGDIYRLQGKFGEAEPLYEQALKIVTTSLDPEHPRAAEALNDLADIYRDRHEFARAEANYKRALAIREKKFGPENLDVAITLDDLGTLYRDEGSASRAAPLYQRALEIDEKGLGADSATVADVLEHMSILEMETGDAAAVEPVLARAINITERNAALILETGSERQKLAYLDFLSAQLDQAITLNTLIAPQDLASRDLAFAAVLQRKGRVQDVLSANFASLRRHLDSAGADLLDRYNRNTSRLARLVLNGPQNGTLEEHQARVNALKEEREALQSSISRRSAEFRANSQPVTIDAVRAALPDDAALLEFIAYKRFAPSGVNANDRLAEPRYAVYVLRRAGDVQCVDLGEAKDIDRVVADFRGALRDPRRADVAQKAKTAYAKILQPIDGMLGGVTHLLVSPDGQLNLIPFEALLDSRGHYSIERYSITYLSTARDLLRMQLPEESKTAPVLVADAFFGEPESPGDHRGVRSKLGRSDRAIAKRSVTTGDDLSTVYFAPLKGTEEEVQQIRSLFPQATVLTGRRATEAAIKDLDAPRFLHIATHGFFLRDADRVEEKSNSQGTRSIDAETTFENPLLRSGLALAGANLHKSGEDGILTAMEAANLNLWGTKLVTLSACDTGVGEVKDGEGVFGLRRSFFLAGTESLVMSLWPVSDYVTRDLMTQYYTGLKNGLGRGEALRQAQLNMLKRKTRRHPFYWASFIEAGKWSPLASKR